MAHKHRLAESDPLIGASKELAAVIVAEALKGNLTRRDIAVDRDPNPLLDIGSSFRGRISSKRLRVRGGVVGLAVDAADGAEYQNALLSLARGLREDRDDYSITRVDSEWKIRLRTWIDDFLEGK